MRRFSGEPDLAEVLTDPIVQALMRADGCGMQSFYDFLPALRDGDHAVAPEDDAPFACARSGRD